MCTVVLCAQSSQASWSQHHKYGLDRAFSKRGHSHVIVLEENMQVSPDFLLYFEVTLPCNDFGKSYAYCIIHSRAWMFIALRAGYGAAAGGRPRTVVHLCLERQQQDTWVPLGCKAHGTFACLALSWPSDAALANALIHQAMRTLKAAVFCCRCAPQFFLVKAGCCGASCGQRSVACGQTAPGKCGCGSLTYPAVSCPCTCCSVPLGWVLFHTVCLAALFAIIAYSLQGGIA
jgi:hypothetical protein